VDGTDHPAESPADAPRRSVARRRAIRFARLALEGIAVLAVALAGVIALLLFFENRDASTAGGGAGQPVRPASGPGAIAPRETSSLLRAGNVVLRYRDREERNALVRYAQREAGTDSTALRKAGLAIVVTRDPTSEAPITAVAFRRTQPIASVRDPALQTFVTAWLGQPG
jgi:hypothetical protein